MFTTVTMRAYEDQLNTGFSKLCADSIVQSMCSPNYVRLINLDTFLKQMICDFTFYTPKCDTKQNKL